MRLSGRFQTCLFFLRKGFERKKAPKARQTTFTLLEVFVLPKNGCLCCLVLAYFCFVSWFSLVTCFCAREIFSLKKRKP